MLELGKLAINSGVTPLGCPITHVGFSTTHSTRTVTGPVTLLMSNPSYLGKKEPFKEAVLLQLAEGE